MMIAYQLSVFFILIISNPLENDLPEVSISNSLTLSLAAVLGLFLQSFDRFFLPKFVWMLHCKSYIFFSLMILVSLEVFHLIAQDGCKSLFYINAG